MANRVSFPVAQTDTATTPASTATCTSAASVQLVAANTGRIEVTVCNTDAANPIWLSLGGTAAVSNGIRVPAGGSYTTHAYTGAINGRASTADVTVSYTDI